MDNKANVSDSLHSTILPKKTLWSRDLLGKDQIDMLRTINSAINHLYDIENRFFDFRDITVEYPIDRRNPIESCARYFLELKEQYDGMAHHCKKELSDLLATVAEELYQIVSTDYSEVCNRPFAYDFMADMFDFNCSSLVQRSVINGMICRYNVSAIIAYTLESLRNELYGGIFDWENIPALLSEVLSEEE